jgi:hypothetical protein
MCTPVSMSASRTMRTYAGPEPERAETRHGQAGSEAMTAAWWHCAYFFGPEGTHPPPKTPRAVSPTRTVIIRGRRQSQGRSSALTHRPMWRSLPELKAPHDDTPL